MTVHRKLDFVIGGVMKAGTCTLDAIFRLHPQIQMASTKEGHFFDDDKRDWNTPDYSALYALFPEVDDRLRGEATPITIYWRPAVLRLRDYNPDIKIILLLRDPVTRAYSHWQQEFSRGREATPFAEAIRGGRDRVRNAPNGQHRVFSYVDRGLYGDQLNCLGDNFPKENIHCEIFEEFFRDRSAGLRRIAAFLGIDPFPSQIPDIHINPAHRVSYPSTLTDDDIGYLSGIFRDQIAAVESFLGRPVRAWKQTGTAPAPAPASQL
jgi:hypothetical protein